LRLASIDRGCHFGRQTLPDLLYQRDAELALQAEHIR
jgi:hypothetical protein